MAVLKNHVPSGFCFGSRAAPRAADPLAPMSLSAAAGRTQRSLDNNQSNPAYPHTWSILGDDMKGRRQCRTTKIQGAQGRVEDPCPIRVLLWLQGGSQGHSSVGSNIVLCSSIGRAQRLSGNVRDADFPHRGSPMGIRGGSGPAPSRSRVLRAVLKTHVPSGFCFGSRAAPRAADPLAPISLSAAV